MPESSCLPPRSRFDSSLERYVGLSFQRALGLKESGFSEETISPPPPTTLNFPLTTNISSVSVCQTRVFLANGLCLIVPRYSPLAHISFLGCPIEIVRNSDGKVILLSRLFHFVGVADGVIDGGRLRLRQLCFPAVQSLTNIDLVSVLGSLIAMATVIWFRSGASLLSVLRDGEGDVGWEVQSALSKPLLTTIFPFFDLIRTDFLKKAMEYASSRHPSLFHFDADECALVIHRSMCDTVLSLATHSLTSDSSVLEWRVIEILEGLHRYSMKVLDFGCASHCVRGLVQDLKSASVGVIPPHVMLADEAGVFAFHQRLFPGQHQGIEGTHALKGLCFIFDEWLEGHVFVEDQTFFHVTPMSSGRISRASGRQAERKSRMGFGGLTAWFKTAVSIGVERALPFVSEPSTAEWLASVSRTAEFRSILDVEDYFDSHLPHTIDRKETRSLVLSAVNTMYGELLRTLGPAELLLGGKRPRQED